MLIASKYGVKDAMPVRPFYGAMTPIAGLAEPKRARCLSAIVKTHTTKWETMNASRGQTLPVMTLGQRLERKPERVRFQFIPKRAHLPMFTAYSMAKLIASYRHQCGCFGRSRTLLHQTQGNRPAQPLPALCHSDPWERVVGVRLSPASYQ